MDAEKQISKINDEIMDTEMKRCQHISDYTIFAENERILLQKVS